MSSAFSPPNSIKRKPPAIPPGAVCLPKLDKLDLGQKTDMAPPAIPSKSYRGEMNKPPIPSKTYREDSPSPTGSADSGMNELISPQAKPRSNKSSPGWDGASTDSDIMLVNEYVMALENFLCQELQNDNNKLSSALKVIHDDLQTGEKATVKFLYHRMKQLDTDNMMKHIENKVTENKECLEAAVKRFIHTDKKRDREMDSTQTLMRLKDTCAEKPGSYDTILYDIYLYSLKSDHEATADYLKNTWKYYSGGSIKKR